MRLAPCFEAMQVTTLSLGLLCGLLAAPPADDPGPFVRALWLAQRHGLPSAIGPAADVSLKARLAKALGKTNTLSAAGAAGLFDASTFAGLAGPDGVLDPGEVRAAHDADAPASRKRLLPAVRAYADLLSTTFDMIDGPHREAGDALTEWIARNHKPGATLDVLVVCTGNSRRSLLGATMGNVATAYYGLPEFRFHSGGTAPSAFNERTIAALRAIGVEVERTGREAPRGEPNTANPVYKVRWGTPGGPPLEAAEFSKHYGDPANPPSGFAALLVCSEADGACPVVKGASARISMPYLDPKLYDGSAFEAAKYAERRDDIGRLILSTMMRARNRVDHPTK